SLETRGWLLDVMNCVESLGKRDADGLAVGPTPLVALGATDQHAQVQLFMEGPADKTITFLRVAKPESDLIIPALEPTIPELAYLGGHSLGELLAVEQEATAAALAAMGRPSMTLTIDRVDAWHLGGLLALFAIATVYAGTLYHVDPLTQPGVELGKRLTYHTMGHPQYHGVAEERAGFPVADPSKSL
ncbi:MAG: hypothetical protein K2X99_10775, partial [Gemmatimonadaceae bacterium]|nr:hypothetical protein [Gemmatimonadaceae bacterium]